MKVGPRAKLLALLAIFALPIVASVLAYNFLDVRPTANYGELIVPPLPAPSEKLRRTDGSSFSFGDLAGKWVLVASDAGACAAACQEKLVTLRQVRLALGRNAERVERVFVAADGQGPGDAALQPFPGMHAVLCARTPGVAGPLGDPAHVYLVDPNGNVMMRWPQPADPRRMLKDLERLLKASQIG
jgi:cytochrome oxidase Cu insertion factor (SCO1/SenC/PrrC family)